MNTKRLFIVALAALLLIGISQAQAATRISSPASSSYNLQAAIPPNGGPIGCRRGLAQPRAYRDLFFDDMESGPANWQVGGSGSTWQIVTDTAHSPIHAWAARVPDVPSYQLLGLAVTVTIPITAPAAGLAFWQQYNFGQVIADGGVLEYRSQPGAPWEDAGPLFLQNGYTGVISGNGNPLAGRMGFVGTSTLFPEYQESILDLSSLVGRQVTFRFIVGSDSAGAAPGWHMDDFEIYACIASQSSPTPTATPTVAPSATAAPPPPTATTCPNPFVDINGNVFYNAILYLYCRGVVNGISPTLYGPAGTSTRAQFAKVVVLGFGIASYTPASPSFNDVPPSYFAYPYIEAGRNAGILSGFDAASCTAAGAIYPCYLPNRAITRAQLTKLAVAAAHYPAYTPATPTFSDVPPSNIFYASIETAYNKRIINGYSDNTFRPNNPIRRDEMAQVVYKAIITP